MSCAVLMKVSEAARLQQGRVFTTLGFDEVKAIGVLSDGG